MDKEMSSLGSSVKAESEVRTNRKEYSDGSYEEVRIEKVEGGYIKTVNKHWKEGDDWKYDEQKSVSIEDPLQEKDSASIAARIEKIFNALD